MAEARNLKSREYNTDIFNVKPTTPQTVNSRAFFQNPNAARVTRASYQDSNIFGYKAH